MVGNQVTSTINVIIKVLLLHSSNAKIQEFVEDILLLVGIQAIVIGKEIISHSYSQLISNKYSSLKVMVKMYVTIVVGDLSFFTPD